MKHLTSRVLQTDLSHNKMLSKGGTNKDGYKIESSSNNRSRNGQAAKKKTKSKTKSK